MHYVGCSWDADMAAEIEGISIGNRMDESAIWEKIARQQGKLHDMKPSAIWNCCNSKFFPKLHSNPWDYLIVMTYLH